MIAGSYLQELRDQESTQLLEDNERQEMNLCQEERLDDFVPNFDETQLLEDYDDSGGRSTRSPIKSEYFWRICCIIRLLPSNLF